jgi:hypothetical protein
MPDRFVAGGTPSSRSPRQPVPPPSCHAAEMARCRVQPPQPHVGQPGSFALAFVIMFLPPVVESRLARDYNQGRRGGGLPVPRPHPVPGRLVRPQRERCFS